MHPPPSPSFFGCLFTSSFSFISFALFLVSASYFASFCFFVSSSSSFTYPSHAPRPPFSPVSRSHPPKGLTFKPPSMGDLFPKPPFNGRRRTAARRLSVPLSFGGAGGGREGALEGLAGRVAGGGRGGGGLRRRFKRISGRRWLRGGRRTFTEMERET